jgi:hypothetical protein
MRHFSILLITSLLITHYSFNPLFAQDLKKIPNTAFIRGEYFKFNVYYDSRVTGKVTAGVATLEVKFEKKEIDGRSCYHVIGEGHSKGAFNLFFRVNDHFESDIDEEYLVPWTFSRKTREGSFIFDDEVKFNQYSGVFSSKRANKKMPVGTHDILSAFFFARNYDFSDARNGETFPIGFLLDDSVYTSVIMYMGKEEIETELGKIRCLHFKPMVITGNVFSQPYPMDVWITDDKNHMPVLGQSAVIIGALKIELVEYKGLANEPDALLDRKK